MSGLASHPTTSLAANPLSDSETRVSPWWLLLVAVLAFSLRVFGLENQGFWFDEIATLEVASQPYSEFAERLRVGENTKPPLYHALVHEWLKFGSSDAWLRLVSALPGAAACVVAGLVGARLFHDRRGWCVGLFLALAPMHVWYSQELRMYSLLTLTGFTTAWFHLRFLETHSRADLIGYGLCALLACYSFTYGIFIIGFCVLFTFLRRPAPTWSTVVRVLIASALAVAGFVPWALRIASAAAAGQGFQIMVKSSSTYEAAAYTLFSFGFGSTFGPTTEALRMHKSAIFRAEPLDSALMIGGLLLLLALLACGAFQAWKRERNAFWFAVLGLLFFWGTPAVLNLLKPQIAYNPRYAIMALLPVGILVVAAAADGPARRWRLGLIALLAAGVTCSLFNHYRNPSYGREDVRGLARVIKVMEPSPQRVFLCPEYLAMVFARYYAGPIPFAELKLALPDAVERLETLLPEVAHAERWVLVLGRKDYGDRQDLLPTWLAQHFTVLDRRKLTGLEILTLGPKDDR